jgi:hypothetical protein
MTTTPRDLPTGGRTPVTIRLKRLLRPLRPVLLPAWRRIQRFVEPSTRWQPFAPVDAGADRPIRVMTEREFDAVARDHPYYGPRGRYLSVAARIADELIASHDLRSALEVGPYLRPLVVGADVIDRKANEDLVLDGSARLLVHDLRNIPWPIEDEAYDLFVALQVFEHLGNAQNRAFREVVRIARQAIISLPIEWEMDDPTNSHHRISNERALSWFLPHRPTRIEIGNPGPRTRLIYVFEDLRPTPPTASDLA